MVSDNEPPTPIRHALVIDDSPSAAEQITRYLHEIGSEVEVHDRAAGAAERALALQPDIIVLDILLPDQSGWEVLQQLKANPRTATIPVLVISVVENQAYAQSLGASAYLLKPIIRENFLTTLNLMRLPLMKKALVVVPTTTGDQPLILLAEDNEENILVLTDYLSSVGYSVIVARNGVEAVAQATERHPALILMDIQMPVMDGLKAIRNIRATGQCAVPIIALTALAMRGDQERCLEAGANSYLPKPVRLRTLATTIARLLASPAAGDTATED